MPTTKKTTTKGQGTLDSLPVSIGKRKVVKGEVVSRGKEIAKNKGGRPSSYNQDTANEFCARIADGQSLRRVCREDDMPSAKTIFNWFESYPEFLQQYARAKEESAEAHADNIQDIADDVLKGNIDPQAARVAGDLLKWTASKLKPKKYGDKLDLTSDGKQLPTPIISIAAAPETKEINS